jgi:hypothetical protein
MYCIVVGTLGGIIAESELIIVQLTNGYQCCNGTDVSNPASDSIKSTQDLRCEMILESGSRDQYKPQ